MKLATLLSLIGNSLPDASASLLFFEKVLSARTRLGVEAALCLDMDVVLMKVKLGQVGDLKEKLSLAKDVLATLKSTESVAFSTYHKACVEFTKVY